MHAFRDRGDHVDRKYRIAAGTMLVMDRSQRIEFFIFKDPAVKHTVLPVQTAFCLPEFHFHFADLCFRLFPHFLAFCPNVRQHRFAVSDLLAHLFSLLFQRIQIIQPLKDLVGKYGIRSFRGGDLVLDTRELPVIFRFVQLTSAPFNVLLVLFQLRLLLNDFQSRFKIPVKLRDPVLQTAYPKDPAIDFIDQYCKLTMHFVQNFKNRIIVCCFHRFRLLIQVFDLRLLSTMKGTAALHCPQADPEQRFLSQNTTSHTAVR